jgi:two-component system sensor histidine kinase CpxA
MKFRVTSIFTKIVLWFALTVALSLAGLLATSVLLSAQLSGRSTIGPRVSTLFLDDARRAYEEGGPSQLNTHLKRLRNVSDSENYLTDRRGIDLVTGADRSALFAARRPMGRRFLPWWLQPRSSPIVRIRTSEDRRYRLITVLPPPPGIGLFESLQYFVWFPILIGVLCYLMAVHLASPLRSLRRVVERFGRGELGIRFHLARHDEIGDLARSFNRMADHITTLLSAERRLLQDVSHELRSPLARLGFAVELARTSTDQEAALGRIRKEADRLNRLVDELLQLTRAEGDPAARNIKAIQVAELLEDLVDDCNVEAEAQGCRLAAEIDPNAIVNGERELLRRACENVLRNAIRHAPAGSSVEIAATSRGDLVTITIRDHGPGVPQDTLADIFKPFYRVEKDRDRSSGGIGLGLAIASRAVDLHQGRMTARNANPGLLVEIQLPAGPISSIG